MNELMNQAWSLFFERLEGLAAIVTTGEEDRGKASQKIIREIIKAFKELKAGAAPAQSPLKELSLDEGTFMAQTGIQELMAKVKDGPNRGRAITDGRHVWNTEWFEPARDALQEIIEKAAPLGWNTELGFQQEKKAGNQPGQLTIKFKKWRARNSREKKASNKAKGPFSALQGGIEGGVRVYPSAMEAYAAIIDCVWAINRKIDNAILLQHSCRFSQGILDPLVKRQAEITVYTADTEVVRRISGERWANSHAIAITEMKGRFRRGDMRVAWKSYRSPSSLSAIWIKAGDSELLMMSWYIYYLMNEYREHYKDDVNDNDVDDPELFKLKGTDQAAFVVLKHDKSDIKFKFYYNMFDEYVKFLEKMQTPRQHQRQDGAVRPGY